MALTNAEIEYMAKMPGALRAIEKQLTRIADALEKLAEGSADVGVKCNKE